MLESSVCTQAQLQSATFKEWSARLRHPPDHMHRKLWEWDYIAQALHERGMLQPGRRGLGFAVGREPLTALFASLGCEILATDLDHNSAASNGWVDSNQHADSLDALNVHGVCPPELLRQRVQFRVVDMNHLPEDLTGFDFCWSSCSIEHLGSIRAGRQFMLNMTRCLKPGGVGVHTTEYNVSSNLFTIWRGGNVLFRGRDLHRMASELEERGHRVAPLNFELGCAPADLHVDRPPYTGLPHLKLRYRGFVATSLGIIVEAGDRVPPRPRTSWWRSWFRRPAASQG